MNMAENSENKINVLSLVFAVYLRSDMNMAECSEKNTSVYLNSDVKPTLHIVYLPKLRCEQC